MCKRGESRKSGLNLERLILICLMKELKLCKIVSGESWKDFELKSEVLVSFIRQ